jgi:hypothetical protein
MHPRLALRVRQTPLKQRRTPPNLFGKCAVCHPCYLRLESKEIRDLTWILYPFSVNCQLKRENSDPRVRPDVLGRLIHALFHVADKGLASDGDLLGDGSQVLVDLVAQRPHLRLQDGDVFDLRVVAAPQRQPDDGDQPLHR